MPKTRNFLHIQMSNLRYVDRKAPTTEEISMKAMNVSSISHEISYKVASRKTYLTKTKKAEDMAWTRPKV